MTDIIVHLTRAARDGGIEQEAIRAAAKAALARIGSPVDIQFLQFKVGSTSFAMSARMVVEVDVFPHKVPDRVIRCAKPVQRSRR